MKGLIYNVILQLIFSDTFPDKTISDKTRNVYPGRIYLEKIGKQGTGKTARAQLVNGTAPKTPKTRAKLCGCREVAYNCPIVYTPQKEIPYVQRDHK